MNKKTIIIGVLVGIAVIGAIYMYRKNKKTSNKNKEDDRSITLNSQSNKESIVVPTTIEDGYEFLSKWNDVKKKALEDVLKSIKAKEYIAKEYIRLVKDKKMHNKVLSLMSKDKTTWNESDKALNDVMVKWWNLIVSTSGTNNSFTTDAGNGKNIIVLSPVKSL